MARSAFLLFLALALPAASARPSPLESTPWTWFAADDFARRRAAVIDSIGGGVAVLLGAELPEAYVKFRQDNTFYYLTGVETPDAVLLLDGRTRRTTLLVPEHAPGDIRREARIEAGPEAAAAYRVDEVLPRRDLDSTLSRALAGGRTVWLYLGPEETASMTPDRSKSLRAKRKIDRWDGRLPRETLFANHVKERFPESAVKDLSPVIHALRWVKDAKEIAVLRECGRIGALGFNEAMRITRPGLHEHQVAAACEFVYQYHGAQNPAFYPIAASGDRALDAHYNANNHPMKAGDLILLDYAPDYHYYVTDITRTWPVDGRFTPQQLKLYACIREFLEKGIAALKPGVTYADLIALGQEIYARHGFDTLWPNYAGHYVGMAVHDVAPRNRPMVAGVVFNLEPIIADPTLGVHLRLEDTILITPEGCEVLTAGTPVDPAAIERLIAEPGIDEMPDRPWKQ